MTGELIGPEWLKQSSDFELGNSRMPEWVLFKLHLLLLLRPCKSNRNLSRDHTLGGFGFFEEGAEATRPGRNHRHRWTQILPGCDA